MKTRHPWTWGMRGMFLASLFVSALYGQEVKKIGTSAASFLRIPVGAKAVAMGSAFTAVGDDGSRVFWNPGTLAGVSHFAFFFHQSPYLPGLEYTFFHAAIPMGRLGVGGIQIISLRSDEMDVTTPEAPMGTGETFDAGSIAVGVTFARNLTDRFSIGGTVKYIQERIYHCQATGVAFDVGTLFISPFKKVRFGVGISNVGTKMQMNGEDLNAYVDIAPTQKGNNEEIVARLKTDRFDLPIVLRLGLARDFHLLKNTRLTLACEGVNPNDNGPSLNVGGEMALFQEILFLRAGMNELFLEDREKGLTLGAGLKISSGGGMVLGFSYAYQTFRFLGGVNHFSIEISF